VFLSEPGRTSYDLNFSLFGVSVRVHPAIFILPIFLGRGLISSEVNTGVGLVLVMAIFFVSILIHELGHAVAFRYYGIPSRIVLYWMGGLAIPDSGNVWGRRSTGSLSSNQQIVVSFAGPAFGFMLAAAMVGVVYLLGGQIIKIEGSLFPILLPDFRATNFPTQGMLFIVCFGGIMLNIILNLLNLVPIYPLDGGQIAREIMVQMDSFNGIRNSIILSIACAGLIAVFSLMNGDQFLGIFFGFMAWSNYQAFQQYGRPRW
jgi:Zn-dependent protease